MDDDISNFGKGKKSWREKIKNTARELRKNQTESEKTIWNIVRDRRLSRKKFLRQHPIIYEVYQRPYYFIADFYCAEVKLIIEIDGSIHNSNYEYDNQRTEVLKSKGLRVLRISNKELHDIEKVKEKIITYLK